MLADLAFPGSVILLKLGFKLLIEQELKAIEVFKAMLAFPIDIAFLSFSFGAAVLYSMEPTQVSVSKIKMLLSLLVIFVLLAMIIASFCKKSNVAFVNDRAMHSIGFSLISYLLATISMVLSLRIGRVF